MFSFRSCTNANKVCFTITTAAERLCSLGLDCCYLTMHALIHRMHPPIALIRYIHCCSPQLMRRKINNRLPFETDTFQWKSAYNFGFLTHRITNHLDWLFVQSKIIRSNLFERWIVIIVFLLLTFRLVAH